jgi:hypothetical protein
MKTARIVALWGWLTLAVTSLAFADPILPAPETIPSLIRNPPKLTSTPLASLGIAPSNRGAVATQTGFSYVGSVAIHPLLFTEPTAVPLDPQQPQVGFGIPRQVATLVLEIEGTKYQLFHVNEVRDGEMGPNDPNRGLKHVTMAVLNQSGSYFRATIDETRGLVFGTLHAKGRTYRVIPRANEPVQDVFRIASPTARARSALDTAVERLERRQLQLEAIARLQPSFARAFPRSKALVLQGGKLGSMANGDVASFKRLLIQLAPMVEADGNEVFELSASDESNGFREYRYQQLLDGIPYRTINDVSVDASGKIVAVTLALAPSDVPREKPRLTAEAVRARVTEALTKDAPSASVEIEGPTLWYEPGAGSGPLIPIYDMRARVSGQHGERYIRVNAVTGEIQVRDAVARSFTTCTRQSGSPQTCGDPGVSTPGPAQTSTILTTVEGKVAGAIGTNQGACCTGLPTMSVIHNYVWSGKPSYNAEAINHTIWLGTGVSGSAEVLSHEWAHTYMREHNPSLTIAIDSQNYFATAISEGVADAVSAMMGANDSTNYGTKWQYGDGPGFSGPPRAAVIDKMWTNVSPSTYLNAHDAGQVFYGYFRRLQDASSISDERVLGIALRVLAVVHDYGCDFQVCDGWDAGDFITAVYSAIKPSETSLRTAAQQVFEAMWPGAVAGGYPPPSPPGIPGPPGAPSAPVFWGGFSHCSAGLLYTIYSTAWSAVSGASNYLGYVKTGSQALYYLDKVWPSTKTSALVYANGVGIVRVAAYNSSGTSGLSGEAVPVEHYCSPEG